MAVLELQPQKLQARIDVANRVLAMFAPGSRIERAAGGFYVCWSNRSQGNMRRRWQCRGGQDFYPTWYRKWAHGGTATTALSQLIRWLRDQPVLPLSTWRYWAGERVRLVKGDAATVLADAGYPETAKCVLCGLELVRGFDWWNLDGVSGPCCNYRAGCRQKLTTDQRG